MTEWYAELFDERYLRFYESLRPARPAAGEADFVVDTLGLEPGARVLDLGCGTGRHAVALAQRGCAVTGLDLSPTLLAEARALATRERVTISLLERDMRDLVGLGPFDAVVCLYTAFGYFDDADNARVLAGVRGALQPAGRFLLDLTNPAPFLRPARSVTWREQAGGVTREVHRYDPASGTLQTERTLFPASGGVVRLPDARLRAYLPYEVTALLGNAGLVADHVYGALEDVPFDWDRSLRHVYVAYRDDRPPEGCGG